MRKVFTNGCFDVIHVGHIRLLQFARQQGDYLVVGLNSDRSVTTLKGPSRPINPEAYRREVLESLRFVDEVVVFDESNAIEILHAIRPAVWVKGGDYTMETLDRGEVAAARKLGAEIILFPTFGGLSTTKLLRSDGSRST